MNLLLIATTIVVIGLLLALVPKERIMRFIYFGLVGGFGTGILLLLVMTTWLGLWQFNPPGLLAVGGFSLVLAFLWAPLEIIYAHYFPSENQWWQVSGYLLALPVAAVIFHWAMSQIGLLTYHNWSYAGTLLVSLVIQTVLAIYLYAYQFKNTLNRV